VVLSAIAQARVATFGTFLATRRRSHGNLKFLASKGYRLGVVQPFDMFPQTGTSRRWFSWSTFRLTPDTIDIRYVAKLARIALSDDEIERFQRSWANCSGTSALEELDTASVPATAQVVESRNVLREDVDGPASIARSSSTVSATPGRVLSRTAHHRRMNAAEIARDVSAGRVSAAEITAATLAQVQAVDGDVGAYLTCSVKSRAPLPAR